MCCCPAVCIYSEVSIGHFLCVYCCRLVKTIHLHIINQINYYWLNAVDYNKTKNSLSQSFTQGCVYPMKMVGKWQHVIL